MAWTSRAERFQSLTSGAGPDPGAYHITSPEKEHSYAPFGSTNPRASPGVRQEGAPVGAYDPKLPKAYDSGLPKRNVAFGASGQRDGSGKNQADLPGPGSYQVLKDLAPPQQSRTFGEPHGEKRSVFRSSSAPSIPQSHQSFGYQELGDGRLVRQRGRAEDLRLKGIPGESAGPGHYEIPQLLASSTPGGSFLNSKRDGPQKPSGPGPGHYISRSEQRGNVSRAPTVSSSFVSQSEARVKHDGSDKPGPGQYNPERRTQSSLRERHAELQYFGSTVERFKPLNKDGAPGPGDYAEQARQLRPAQKPFCSSEGRFQAKPTKTPGPGQYDPALESSTTGVLGTVSILGAMGGLAFGTMEKKGNSLSASSFPGPGAYDIASLGDSETEAQRDPRMKKGRVAKMPHSVFKSATPKDIVNKSAARDGETKPAPGAYNPPHMRDATPVVRMPAKNEGFLSASNRFSYSTKGAAPGPGQYDPADPKGGKHQLETFNRSMIEGVPQNGRPKCLAFTSTDRRFSGAPSEQKPWKQTPGPGAYSTNNGWITQTHNIYFGELT
mmetsp:Transcript_113007/g.319701  ORF Transcript_113007/g.319701 Transcript_113007/m.319701 type:complete len:552 (-) Transcript_113007:64-1719(-)